MTREEAIDNNKNLRLYMRLSDKNQPCKFLEENYIALDMAIKALEQEPCDDAISRQAVLDLMRSLKRWYVRSQDRKFNSVGLLYDDVMFGIDKLPSVRPQEPLTEEDYKELHDRFGDYVEFVVRDMVSGTGERWRKKESDDKGMSNELVEHYRKLAEHYDKRND